MDQFDHKEGTRLSGAFRPDNDEPDFAFSGQRKQPQNVESQPLFWPKNRKEQEIAFWAWHAVAMQMADKVGYKFRVLAVLHKLMFWQDGTIRATNECIAMRAGRCSEKTITRDISYLEGLGLLRIRMFYDTETEKTRRVIIMSYPKEAAGIILPDDDEE